MNRRRNTELINHRTDILTRVYTGLVAYWDKNQISPTLEELTRSIGYASKSNMLGYLKELERMGLVEMTRYKARSIKVVGAVWIAPDMPAKLKG